MHAHDNFVEKGPSIIEETAACATADTPTQQAVGDDLQTLTEDGLKYEEAIALLNEKVGRMTLKEKAKYGPVFLNCVKKVNTTSALTSALSTFGKYGETQFKGRSRIPKTNPTRRILTLQKRGRPTKASQDSSALSCVKKVCNEPFRNVKAHGRPPVKDKHKLSEKVYENKA